MSVVAVADCDYLLSKQIVTQGREFDNYDHAVQVSL